MRPGPRPRHDASRFCGPSLALPARSPLRRLSGLKRLGRSGVAQTASGTGRRAACRVQASRRGDTRGCAPRRLRALRCPSCPQGPEPGLADPRRATTGTPPCHSRLRLLAMMAGIRSGCSADRIVTELGSGIGLPVRILPAYLYFGKPIFGNFLSRKGHFFSDPPLYGCVYAGCAHVMCCSRIVVVFF